MAKIGFFIQSSNQELFVNNTNVLKEYYHKIIEENRYDIDLYSFVGNPNIEDTYEDGDVIYCKASDRYPNKKYSVLFKYILANKKYDYILITNNTTLTNIPYLYNAVDSLDPSAYYCTIIIKNFMNYPNGNVKLMSWDVFCKIAADYDTAYHCVLPVNEFIFGNTFVADVDPCMWAGAPEDMIIGACLHRNRIPYMKINEYCTIHEYLDAPILEVVEWNTVAFLTFKITAYYEVRLEHETEELKNIIRQISAPE